MQSFAHAVTSLTPLSSTGLSNELVDEVTATSKLNNGPCSQSSMWFVVVVVVVLTVAVVVAVVVCEDVRLVVVVGVVVVVSVEVWLVVWLEVKEVVVVGSRHPPSATRV